MSYTTISIENMRAKAVAGYKATRKLLKSLKKQKPQTIDKYFHAQHSKEFDQIDCLECANCCKTISPAMYTSDVKRMASAMKMKMQDFIDAYLNLDEDEEYVFKNSPCPFLGDNNYCVIYPSRPKACREYPHTDRKRMYQILDLTARNTKVCPAIFNIVERLKQDRKI
jgi:Fe-S-cluster containining protein